MMKILERFERGGQAPPQSDAEDDQEDPNRGALDFQDFLKNLDDTAGETQDEEDIEQQQLMGALANVDIGQSPVSKRFRPDTTY